MSMFNDISWRTEDSEQECDAKADLVSIYAKKFSPGRWSFLGPGSEKKWYSTHGCRPQGEWDRVAELMMIAFRESGHPVFRGTSPLFRETLKSKGGEKISIRFCADGDTIDTFFRTIISVNQLSILGAVSDLCKEYSTSQARTVWHVLAEPIHCLSQQVCWWQHPHLPTEVPAQEDLLQKCQERVERLLTIRSCDKNLYWCRIPENSWSRTVLRDRGHWRVLTFYRNSDMSWVHFATRWKAIWPERLDSREHQNWAHATSHKQLLARLIWSGNV